MVGIRSIAIAVSLVAVAAPAIAADYVEQIVSPVFEAPGDRAALTRRAGTCLAQSNAGSPAAIRSDEVGGTVVGAVLFSYSQAAVPWSVRSTLTVELKDGRFRLTHTNLTQKQGGPAVPSGSSILSDSVDQRTEGGWMRVGDWRFSGAEKVRAAADAVSQRIANCIESKAKEDW
ncbi:MAG: hypothetical protein JWO33_2185 [Caulobacteraceae bacterium]|nr:hypothetical protein [Caulobacteraceae bacterium]